MASKILHAFPRFPQSAKEILAGAAIGSSTAYILLTPLPFSALAICFVGLVCLVINASRR
jgi:hypothetical protein